MDVLNTLLKPLRLRKTDNMLDINAKYQKLLNCGRGDGGRQGDCSCADDLQKDRGRIVYSSSFRRMQQKAQVFSLENNANIHSRLAHTIEVSSIARSISQKIAEVLVGQMGLNCDLASNMLLAVENAALMHDIGNPPFGHFGEESIRAWARKRVTRICHKRSLSSKERELVGDFLNFDGNPQGFRVVSKLHCCEEGGRRSLCLTNATLASSMKYDNPPKGSSERFEKSGYFHSESDTARNALKACSADGTSIQRHPFSYIVEAADDIAFLFSDVSDGIKKGVLTASAYASEVQSVWERGEEGTAFPLGSPDPFGLTYLNDLSAFWSKRLIDHAVSSYIEQHDSLMEGNAISLLSFDASCPDVVGALECIREVNRRLVYNSRLAEEVEISGYRLINGLLRSYGRLLGLDESEFSGLMNGRGYADDPLLEKISNRMSRRLYLNYCLELREFGSFREFGVDREFGEKWLRTHLVIDQISGMTDVYALAEYKVFQGML